MQSESSSSSVSTPLVVGLSTRALFDLRAEDEVLRAGGAEALRRHRSEREEELLDPGLGLPLARALGQVDPGAARRVELVLVSKESAESSLRVVSSARRHELEIARAVFTGGQPLDPYLAALRVDLFLCSDEAEVQAALEAGISAGVVCDGGELARDGESEIRVVFDGDAELFADDGGAAGEAAADPASRNAGRGAPASFARLLGALAVLGSDGHGRGAKLRTALVSSRSGAAQERMLRTLRRFGLALDEAFFVGDLPKPEILAAFRPHVSFGEHPRAAAARTLRPVAAVASPEPEEGARSGNLASPLGRLRFRQGTGG
jgi:5'-nucleotidase